MYIPTVHTDKSVFDRICSEPLSKLGTRGSEYKEN